MLQPVTACEHRAACAVPVPIKVSSCQLLACCKPACTSMRTCVRDWEEADSWASLGVRNDFLIATGAEMALRYNDVSVNENMHASLAHELLYTPRNNFVEHLHEDERRFMRRLIVASILSTDMSVHSELLKVGIPHCAAGLCAPSLDSVLDLPWRIAVGALSEGIAPRAEQALPWRSQGAWHDRTCAGDEQLDTTSAWQPRFST